jgi:hypothetical protein
VLAGAVGVTTTMLETVAFVCGAVPVTMTMLVGTLPGPDGTTDALLVALTPELELTLTTGAAVDAGAVWLLEG